MNTEKLYALAGNIEDRFVAETMKKKVRPHYVRYLAAAAVLLLTIGAVFGIAHAASQTEKATDIENANLTLTSVPKDAVLPPARYGVSTVSAEYVRNYTFDEAFSEAEAVCLVRIGNWLEETDAGTFYQATALATYKGEISSEFVLYTIGNSEFTFKETPLFTYGDMLLVFLTHRERSGYKNSYESIGADISILYAAQDDNNRIYLLDHRGLFSYTTAERSPETVITDYGKDERLVERLSAKMRVYDKLMADYIEYYCYCSVYDSDNVPFPLHVYLLEEFTAIF